MAAAAHPNSFKARKTLKVGAKSYTYWSLKAVEKEVGDLSRLPFSLRILMENLVRHEDGTTVKKADIAAFADWVKNGGKSKKEINALGLAVAPGFINMLSQADESLIEAERHSHEKNGTKVVSLQRWRSGSRPGREAPGEAPGETDE